MTVLMLGQHLEVGWNHGEFLRGHGYTVIFPENRDQALAAIANDSFDVILLSYSLSQKTSQELLDLVEQRCPDCPVIAITEQRWDDRHANLAATVLVGEGPQALLDALERVDHRGNGAGLRRVK